jgi:hypothetical protein
VALTQELLERIEEREKRVEAMTAQECVTAASMLRQAKPRLGTNRQRELADEMASQFEAQAATKARAVS